MKKLSLWKIIKEGLENEDTGFIPPRGNREINPAVKSLNDLIKLNYHKPNQTIPLQDLYNKYSNLDNHDWDIIFNAPHTKHNYVEISNPEILEKIPDLEEFAEDLSKAKIFGQVNGVYRGNEATPSELKQSVSTPQFKKSSEQSKQANFQRHGSNDNAFDEFEQEMPEEEINQQEPNWTNQWKQNHSNNKARKMSLAKTIPMSDQQMKRIHSMSQPSETNPAGPAGFRKRMRK